MAEDKRRYARYENQSLSIAVARPGLKGIIRANPAADCTNFSRTGIQFEADQVLNIGERLLMDIAIDDTEINDLNAEVVSVNDLGNGSWCYGTRFCLEQTKASDAKIFHNLLLMEEKLKQSSRS